MCLKTGTWKKYAALLIGGLQFMQGISTFILASNGSIKLANHTGFLMVVVASAMNMWVGLVLCIGIMSNRPSLLRVWLGWATVVVMLFIIAVPVTIVLSFTEYYKNMNLTATLAKYSLLLLLHCLFIHIVYGCYEDVMKTQMENIESSFETGQGSYLDQDIHGYPVVTNLPPNQYPTYHIKNEIYH